MSYEIKEVFFANGIISQSAIGHPSEGMPPAGEKLLSALEGMTHLEEKKTNALLQFYEALLCGLRIEFQSSDILTGISERNFLLVYFDFPGVYLKEIEKLLFDWRVACFAEDYHNPSMWCNYADGHKGACLIFESTDGSLQLDLDKEAIGFSKVAYRNQLNEIDFFRSISRATVGQLKELWYTDAAGNFSECGDHILRYSEIDRKNYWKNHYRDTTSKTRDWEHEQEWRLAPESRWLREDHKLTYDFNSLKGIIFGIWASDEDIFKAIKIIQKKCKCEKPERTDFKFYKAYRSQRGDIRKNEMQLP